MQCNILIFVSIYLMHFLLILGRKTHFNLFSSPMCIFPIQGKVKEIFYLQETVRGVWVTRELGRKQVPEGRVEAWQLTIASLLEEGHHLFRSRETSLASGDDAPWWKVRVVMGKHLADSVDPITLGTQGETLGASATSWEMKIAAGPLSQFLFCCCDKLLWQKELKGEGFL